MEHGYSLVKVVVEKGNGDENLLQEVPVGDHGVRAWLGPSPRHGQVLGDISPSLPSEPSFSRDLNMQHCLKSLSPYPCFKNRPKQGWGFPKSR